MSLPAGNLVVPVRIAILSIVFLTQTAQAQERGPVPREVRLDKDGYPMPAGAVARLGVPHVLGGFPWAVAWSADGKRLVVGDSGGVIEFDASTGRPEESHKLNLAGASPRGPLTRDGRFVAVLTGRSGCLYDTSTSHVRPFTLPASFADLDRKSYSLSLSADGRFLAGILAPTSRPGVAWRYDFARDRFARVVTDRADVHSVRLSPDGRLLYATGGARDSELTARDLAAGRELWTVKLRSVGTIRAISADGRRVAASDRDGFAVFDAADGRAVVVVPIDSTTPQGLWAIDLSPDGTRIAVGIGREVTVWEVDSGKVCQRFAHLTRVVSFSPDGKSLVAAGAWVQRWDVETGRPAFPVPLLDKPVGATHLKWSRDGKRLLTVWPSERPGTESRPGTLAVWDVASMKSVWRHPLAAGVVVAAIDATGTTVRAYTSDQKLRTWELGSHVVEKSWPVADSSGGAGRRFFTFLADGRLAVQNHLDSQADVKIYGPGNEVVTGPPYRRPAREWFRPQYRHGVGAMTILPNGARINLLTGRPAPLLSSRLPISGLLTGWINAPELFVACRVSAQVGPETRVWESWTGHLIARRTLYISELAQASLSPDGRFVADGSTVQTYVTDLSTHEGTRPLPIRETSALEFSPDARRLATALSDGTVLVWDVPRARLEWGTTEPETVWSDLISDDAQRAWRTIWLLLDHPDRTIKLLRDLVRPVSNEKDTWDLIVRLDHAKFAIREEATRTLASRGDTVEMDLVAAHQKTSSAEQRARLELLINKLDPAVPPAGETLRGLRIVWLLERIGTAEAKRLLTAIAGGATGSRVTGEAKAALERLGR